MKTHKNDNRRNNDITIAKKSIHHDNKCANSTAISNPLPLQIRQLAKRTSFDCKMFVGVEFDSEIFCESSGILGRESVGCHGPESVGELAQVSAECILVFMEE
jgi:hypothetical protein